MSAEVHARPARRFAKRISVSRSHSGHSADDRHLHRIRLAQVLRYDIGANVAALALLLGVWVGITRRPEILLLAALVAGHLAGDVWLYRRVHVWDGIRLVAVFTIGIWAVAVLATLVVPAVVVVMTITSLYPAVLAVPYVTQRSLRALVAGLVAVTTMLAVASQHMWVSAIGEIVPRWLKAGIVIAFVPIMTGAIVLLLSQTYAWLKESLAAAVEANGALEVSRRQVEEHAAQLQASRVRVVAAADTERRRIERDLHDGAQQSLIAAALCARRAQDLCPVDPDAAAEALGRVIAALDRAGTELRDLANGLYPAVLTDQGLAAALTKAAANSPLPTQVNAVAIGRYPAAVEAAAYFCCVEAMQNAAKHAGRDARVSVQLSGADGRLVCVVADDGAGFDPRTHIRQDPGKGLTNMADRVAAAGGRLTISSGPGEGTRIRVDLPLPAAPPRGESVQQR